MKVSLLFVFAILLISCQDNIPFIEEEQPSSNVLFPEVDERLWPYFIEFENAAAARGFDINLRDLEISGEIDNIPEQNVAGTCQYGSHLSHVTVDQEYWNNSNAQFREFVIFHELGHCVLHRGHAEGAFSNGICRSIMRSGIGECRDAYIPANREYYLDELFSNN